MNFHLDCTGQDSDILILMEIVIRPRGCAKSDCCAINFMVKIIIYMDKCASLQARCFFWMEIFPYDHINTRKQAAGMQLQRCRCNIFLTAVETKFYWQAR